MNGTKPQNPAHGFTIEILEAPDPSCSIWVELRFTNPPNKEWRQLAEDILNRISCSRPVELGGKCRSHSPEYTNLILEDALQHL